MKSVENTRLASIQDLHSIEVTTPDRSHEVSRAFLAAMGANLIWGMSFLASKYTLLSWGPLTASAIRFILATLTLLLFTMFTGKSIRTPSTWPSFGKLFLLALTGFGILYPLQLTGLKHISSGMSSAIMLLSPLLVLVFARFFSGDRFTKNKIVAVILGIVGGTILCFAQPGNILVTQSSYVSGIVLTLLAAGALAISAIFTRQLSSQLDSLSITFWSMLMGAMMLIAGAVTLEGDSALTTIFHASTISWIAVVFLATICSALCFFLWNYALAKSPASEIASTMHIKTPTAILLGVAVAGESISAPLILGASIVAFAVWLSQRSPKGMASLKTFAPDLIIEATTVCDRACNGCYAPNVVSNDDAKLLSQQNPSLFLSQEKLASTLLALPKIPKKISIRGGEPTRHPALASVLSQCTSVAPTVLETHGRWLLSPSDKMLLSSLKQHSIIVKLSFDSMHGTSGGELRTMVSVLNNHGIEFLVAITESDTSAFNKTRNHCQFISDDKIIFQKKAIISEELFRPAIGVIGVNGLLNQTLNHRNGIFKRTLSV